MIFERIINYLSEFEIAPLDEDTQKDVIRRIFYAGTIFTMLIVIGWGLSTIPPDTRSDYQRLYDNCVSEEHVQYIMIDNYGFGCDALLDAFIMNGSKITSTVSDKDGDITAYILERP